MISTKWILKENSNPPLYTLDFDERPACPECGMLANVHSYSKPSTKVGLHGTYQISYVSYKCCNISCINHKRKRINPPNNRCGSNHRFYYEVEAKICEVRFNGLKNLEEIENYFLFIHDIKISTRTTGKIIKRYEIASKHENEAMVLDLLKKQGWTIICLDALHPYKGASMLLVALDHETGKCIYVEKVKTQKFEVQKVFQEKLMEDNKILVLGIMSDGHKSQRKAIKAVWGENIPHCSCLFHFYKQILKKPLELDSKLIKNIRKALRDIHWVELYRRGDLQMEQNSQISHYLEKVIKDLFALTKWKTGRNNFHFDATKYYKRIEYFHEELTKFQSNLDENDFSLAKQEMRILPALILRLNMILIDGRPMHEELTSIQTSLQWIKEILDKHSESSEIGLDNLKEVALKLKKREKEKRRIRKHEKHFINEFEDFIFDRGQTLFNYRIVNENYIKFNKEIQDRIQSSNSSEEKEKIQKELYALRTNNSLESKFKLLRYNIKRTLGQHHANRYLLAHGEYVLHVDINAPFEKIKKILQNADYNRISEESVSKIIPRLSRLTQIRDDKLFESVKKEYHEIHRRIFSTVKK
ncbi:MAG: hypothetical protein ACTSVK_07455 [Promethearchaeota archaeon]